MNSKDFADYISLRVRSLSVPSPAVRQMWCQWKAKFHLCLETLQCYDCFCRPRACWARSAGLGILTQNEGFRSWLLLNHFGIIANISSPTLQSLLLIHVIFPFFQNQHEKSKRPKQLAWKINRKHKRRQDTETHFTQQQLSCWAKNFGIGIRPSSSASWDIVLLPKHRMHLNMTLAGLEPAIFGSEDQCLIH